MFTRSKEKQSVQKEIDPSNLPEHIAIIMDGNGRWQKRGDCLGLPDIGKE